MSLPVHTVQVCSAWKVLFYFSSSLVSVDLLDSVFTGIGCVISTSWIVTIDTKWRNCHSQLYLLQRWWGLLRNSRIRLMIEFQDMQIFFSLCSKDHQFDRHLPFMFYILFIFFTKVLVGPSGEPLVPMGEFTEIFDAPISLDSSKRPPKSSHIPSKVRHTYMYTYIRSWVWDLSLILNLGRIDFCEPYWKLCFENILFWKRRRFEEYRWLLLIGD